MSNLIYLSVKRLHPHPDNPRKDLGDLSELADSIKANGVLQNLTVVVDDPGSTISDFTVIIGHRRLAAAKLAGLETLPCVIAELSPKEQVQTMLLENMQRADLTLYEQAQGFQMMLDLGDSVEEIARKSGFSQSTVRRRVKLLALDQDEFKASVGRGATLSDYMELDKIEDIQLKNEVLSAIGTNNFRNKLASAIQTEKTRKFLAERVADISQWATEIKDGLDKLSYLRNYGLWNWKKDSVVERPADADTVNYYYRVGQNQIDIYMEKVEQEETEEERQYAIARAESERRGDELQRITERHFSLRFEFVSWFGGAQKHVADICRFAANVIVGDGDWSRDMVNTELLAELLGVDIDENMDYTTFKAELEKPVAEKPEYALLASAFASIDDDDNGYFDKTWDRDTRMWHYVHSPNEELDRLYDLLVSLGYEMSDEERAIQDGSHELFQPGCAE